MKLCDEFKVVSEHMTKKWNGHPEAPFKLSKESYGSAAIDHFCRCDIQST
jgi:hypothetical protein